MSSYLLMLLYHHLPYARTPTQCVWVHYAWLVWFQLVPAIIHLIPIAVSWIVDDSHWTEEKYETKCNSGVMCHAIKWIHANIDVLVVIADKQLVAMNHSYIALLELFIPLPWLHIGPCRYSFFLFRVWFGYEKNINIIPFFPLLGINFDCDTGFDWSI